MVRGYQLYVDIRAWISMWISTLGELKTDIPKSWISIWITVDFLKSMHRYAMDTRTRGHCQAKDLIECIREISGISRSEILAKRNIGHSTFPKLL